MTSTLSSKLTTLSESNKTISTLVHRLGKLNFQPGSTPLHGDEGDVRVELSSEIHDNLKQQEEELELLKQEVEDVSAGSRAPNKRRDSEKNRDKARLVVQVARLEEDLKNLRSQFRQAQLQAKRNAEQAKQKERQLLFSGIKEGNITPKGSRKRGQEKLSADDLLVGSSSDVTTALRRTHQLMRSELSRSRFAQETLEESTAALQDLGERYGSLDDLLSTSKNLVVTLLKSQKSDTWYLETALYILITTIVWLVFRRFLYGPLWWFVWLPVKLVYKVFYFGGSSLGLVGSATTTAIVSTSTRKPLIIKPSATDRPPRRVQDQQNIEYYRRGNGGIAVGAGGRGAKVAPSDPSPDGSMSQKVGQMAEAAKAAVSSNSQENKPDDPQPKQAERGDGQSLEDTDKPRNPKKRMFEANVEDDKHTKKDEL
ncbi:Sec20 domain-containing protein [Pseudovirgaria hyperparasitica]|uniref:Sec20 domain-containing protein n=1 Tax=Pseudovirgaria hyperparasitica TaxID=470096 RepID=A0A6A6W5A3_9PEZI|nr:Sec20 domain-containing protein [Pseudovirgaria hyperparasitica]KAF2756737.1 Sec20 domain-containing protein [Pseudovirgaria hyperparasitica]